MKRWTRIAVALLFGVAGNGSATQPPAGQLYLSPRQESYYVGQVVRMVIELKLTDSELGGNVSVEGLPDPAWARPGPFHESPTDSSIRSGRLVTTKRFSSELRLSRAGTFQIALALSGTTAKRTRQGFMSVLSQTPFRIALEPLAVRVHPLPGAPPPDFCGAIGRFRITATMTPDSVSPGDLVNLRWRIEGIGNLEAFHAPSFPVPDTFRAYAPRKERRQKDRLVEVSQVVIPQSLEATQLPALSLSVFDPEQGHYVRHTAGPFTLALQPRVSPSPPSETTPSPLTPTVPAPETASSTERPLLTLPSTARLGPLLVLLGGLALAIFLFAAIASHSRRMALLVACLAAVASAGLRSVLIRRERSNEITLSRAAASRLSPSARSRRLGSLPKGVTVRILEQSGDWIRVEHEGASGWIQILEALTEETEKHPAQETPEPWASHP